MKFLRNHWYHLTLIWFVGCTYFLLIKQNYLQTELQLLLWLSLMTLFLHQFEEYVFPGGAPIVINQALYGNTSSSQDHYPGNALSIMIVNLSAYLFYIVAIIQPNWWWLGIATMMFNCSQVIGHGLEMNIKLKSWYNPGLATSLFLFLPLSCRYFVLICRQPAVQPMTWLWGTLGFIGIMILTVVLPVQGLKNKDSQYVIPQTQIKQLHKVLAITSWRKTKI